MASMLNTVSTNLLHPLAGAVSVYNSTRARSNTDRFDNTATVSGIMIFIIVLAITLWVMSLVATYKLTSSKLQVVLCLLFGSMYLFIAWLYYGFSNYKFVKN